MRHLAAAGDTWGIAGPTFLVGYLVVAALAVAVSVLARRRLFAGDPTAGRPGLHPQQVAYLDGGAQRAMQASLAGLRAAGVVGLAATDGVETSGRRVAVRRRRQAPLAPTGALPAGATALDTAVYNAAGKGVTGAALATDAWVAAALRGLREDLEATGLAVGPPARRQARRWALPVFAVALVGAARVVAGLDAGRPVLYLVPVVLLLGIVAAVQVRRVPTVARTGTAAVRSVRREHKHLSPDQSPAYVTYGDDSAAMGVALYGSAAFWAFDPGFAGEAGIQRAPESGGGSGDSGGGSSGGDSGGGDGGGGGCGGGGGGGCGG